MVLLFAGCTVSEASSTRPILMRSDARVSLAPIPPLHLRPFSAAGSYPQVSVGGSPLERANRTIRRAALATEWRYRRASTVDKRFQARQLYVGKIMRFMLLSGNAAAVEADARFVSLMEPLVQCGGCANEEVGMGWFSLTALTRGRQIHLWDLFRRAERRRALVRFAGLVRRRLVRRSWCVPSELSDPASRGSYVIGLRPVWFNFRHFMLGPTGLVIGFNAGVVAEDACTTPSVSVPYGSFDRLLGRLGRELVDGSSLSRLAQRPGWYP